MNTPLRVLYTIPNFATAGSGQLLVHLISNLDRGRFEPSVCVAKLSQGFLEAELRSSGVDLFEAAFTIPPNPRSTLLWRARRRSHDFREGSFDLWHSFHYLDDYTEPLIARFSGCKAWFYTKKNMSWNERSWRLRSRLAHGIAAQNSDMQKDFFGTRSLQRKTRYIPSGVDVSSFVPAGENWEAKASTRVGCVAHLLPIKGHSTLVQASAKVSQPIQVLLAGREADASYSARIAELIRDLDLHGRVSLVGPVHDVCGFLQGLDIFVFPSLGEGCPVALLEAMSCGLACVASDVPGNRDLIVNDESGLLVPAKDPEALANALDRLVSSRELRQKLGRAARVRCVENFSTALEAQRCMDFYGEILGH